MRRTALSILLAVLATGCAKHVRTGDLTPPPSREVIRNLPGWYSRPPTDNNILFGPATAVSGDLQIAINKAQTEGRNLISQQLEVKYNGLNKRFAEEVGRSNDAQLLDQYTQVYKAVVSQVLYGSRSRQQVLRTEGDVYRAFVLMELPLGEMSKRLMEQIKTQEQLYTRFRASEAFKELDAEVQRYEAWKRGQIPPG
jgi:hypothetical protein